jgi:hypothetical protein
LRLHNVEANYTELVHRHQTHLLKTSHPIELTVLAINLPFVNGQHFDGLDVLNDSQKNRKRKLGPTSQCSWEKVFLVDMFVMRWSNKSNSWSEKRRTHLGGLLAWWTSLGWNSCSAL